MKTAAAVVLVLAIFGYAKSHKHKHKEQPPPPVPVPVVTPASPAIPPMGITLGAECYIDPNSTIDTSAQQRIRKFGRQVVRTPVSDEVLDQVTACIVYYSRANMIPPELSAALIARESSFNPGAVSPTGAKGLGQLIDSTARMMGVTDPFDVNQNLKGSIAYFRTLLTKWQAEPDQVELSIASYLVGPGTVERAGGIPTDPAISRYITDILAYRDRINTM